jgi:hypothetical protein
MCRFRAVRICLFLPVFLFAGSGPSVAQKLPAATMPAAPTLARLTRSSAYIFSGTVVAIRRLAPASSGALAAVQITFHVDQAIQGVRTGQMLTIREWAGLWESGEHYRKGERVMVFLHRPSPMGLTSTVGGPMGRFTVDRSGAVVLGPGKFPALWPRSTTPVTPLLKTRVSRRDFARAVLQAGRQ